MQPTRVTKGRDKQEYLHLAAGDLNQALAKIDLKLLAGRRLKPHRGAGLCQELLAIAGHRPLHGAQRNDDALLRRQLLADHVGIAAMPAQALSQPLLVTIQHLFALRLSVRRPTAGRDVLLGRVAADPEFSGNPFGAPPQLVEPEDRRNLFRLQHRLPPRIIEPQRA